MTLAAFWMARRRRL